VVLITEETPEASLLAVSRALEAAPMVAAVSMLAAPTAAVEGIDDREHTHLDLVKIQEWRKCNAA
jgi:hypothetical protein